MLNISLLNCVHVHTARKTNFSIGKMANVASNNVINVFASDTHNDDFHFLTLCDSISSEP